MLRIKKLYELIYMRVVDNKMAESSKLTIAKLFAFIIGLLSVLILQTPATSATPISEKDLSLMAAKARSYGALASCRDAIGKIDDYVGINPIDGKKYDEYKKSKAKITNDLSFYAHHSYSDYSGIAVTASYIGYGTYKEDDINYKTQPCTISNMQSKINEMSKGTDKKFDLEARLKEKAHKSSCADNDNSSECLNELSTAEVVEILNYALDNFSIYKESNLPNAAKWMLWSDAFAKCTDKDPRKPGSYKEQTSLSADERYEIAAGKGSALVTNDKGELSLSSQPVYIKKNSVNKKTKQFLPYAGYSPNNFAINGNPNDSSQTLVSGVSLDNGNIAGLVSCNTIRKNVEKYFVDYVNNYNDCLKDENCESLKIGENLTDGSTPDDPPEEDDKCTSSFRGFGWLMCPGQTLIMDAVDGFYKWIANSLKWTVLANNEYDGKSVHDIWRSFLDIANIVFAIIFLVMIYSMATSTGLSNYDIKKILPRLVVVVVAVNLSFYICAALVDISNIIGSSVYDMIFGMAKESTSWDAADAWLNGLTSIVLGVIAIFVFGGAAIIALAIIIACIVFRQIALVVLIVISPIAFALYMLPNTQKWYKKWFNLFTKLLIVYPAFTAMWGASRLIANIFATGTVDNGIPGFIINFACAIAPAVAVVPLFKATGGLMATVAGYTAGKMNASGIGKKVNKAGRNMVKNNPATRAATRGISNTAGKFGANNANAQYNNALANATLGTAQRFAGRKALGLSNAAGGHANSIQTQLQTIDNAAMDAANTQLSTLDNNALKAIITTGTYNGKQADQYTLRTAMNLAGDKMDANEVSDMLTAMNTRIVAARGKGNVSEANNLQKATIAAANASGNYLGKASALSNIGSYSNNDTNWYNNSIADKIAGSSSNSIAGMSGASLEKVNQAIKAANDAKAKDGAISAMRKAEQDIQNNPELQSKLSAKAASNINDIAKQSRKITAGSSDADVSRHHINDLRQAYNSGDANLRATAIKRGNEIINNPELLNKTTGLATNEQNILQEIAIGKITNV